MGRGRRGSRRPTPGRNWRATGSSRTSWCWPTSRSRRSSRESKCPLSTGCTTFPTPSAWTICSTCSPAWDCPTPLFDPMLATSEDVRRVMRETAEWIDTHAAAGLGRAALTQQVLRAQARAVYDDGQHRALRTGVAHVLPLHVAHPPVSGPSGAPRLARPLGAGARAERCLPVRMGRAVFEDRARSGQDRTQGG